MSSSLLDTDHVFIVEFFVDGRWKTYKPFKRVGFAKTSLIASWVGGIINSQVDARITKVYYDSRSQELVWYGKLSEAKAGAW